jgi:hypothetical protein
MSINVTVSDSGVGSFEITQVTDTTADLNVTADATISLEVEGGVGAPGAGNVTLAAGTGISIAVDGTTATIAATAQAVSGSDLADLQNVNTTAPSVGEVLAWSGSDWRPTADSTLTLSDSVAEALGTGAAGTATDAARSDHVHNMPTFADITNGTATTSTNLTLDPATGSVIVQGGTGGSGALTLNCQQNSHGVTIQGPPHSASATYTLTLPEDTGTQGQVLTTSGAGGVLSWQGAAGGVSFVDPPTNSESDGTPGQLAYDTNYLYVHNDNGWRRIAFSGWGLSIVINTQPQNVETSVGSLVTFTVDAQTSEGGSVSYQWQESINNGAYTSLVGETSASYSFAASSAATDSVYRVMLMATGAQTEYSDTCVVTLSTEASNLLLIASGDHLHAENGDGLLHSGLSSSITFTTQPTDQNVSAGAATFSVTVSNSGAGSVSLQWQRSTDNGSTWTSIAGETNNTLSLTGLTAANDGEQFRVLANAAGSGEAISDAVTLTYPSTNVDTTVTSTDVARLGTHSTDLQGTNLVMSGDGSTVIGYSVDDSKVYVYKQNGSAFELDRAIEVYDSNNDPEDLQHSSIAVTDNGNMFAICVPRGGTDVLASQIPSGQDPDDYPVGSVRTFARDNSAVGTGNAWGQLHSKINGGTGNYYYTYGGGYITLPLSECAISDDGSVLFVLTTVESGYHYTNKESRVDIYDNDSYYGWTLRHTISGNDNANFQDGNWRSLQCNDAGTEIGFIKTKGWNSSLNDGNGAYGGWITTISGTGTSWSSSTTPTAHDPNMTGNNNYRYKFSRDLRTVAASFGGHTQGQTARVGKIEVVNYSSSAWTLGGSALGISQNDRLTMHDVSKDGTYVYATDGSHFYTQNSQAFQYSQNTAGTSLTRTISYTIPAIDPQPTGNTSLTHHNAVWVATSDDGERAAIYYHSGAGANYRRLDVIE